MTDLRCVRSQARFRRESFPADVAMEGTILRPLNLCVVIPQMLLQIRQLNEGSSAVRQVALVRALTCKNGSDVACVRNGRRDIRFRQCAVNDNISRTASHYPNFTFTHFLHNKPIHIIKINTITTKIAISVTILGRSIFCICTLIQTMLVTCM